MRIFCALGAAFLLNACIHLPQPALADNPSAVPPIKPPSQPSSPPSYAASARQATAADSAPLPTTVTYHTASASSLASRPDVQTFIGEMVSKHGFSADELEKVFSRAAAQPEIIAMITRPAESKPWSAYRGIFLTPQRIQGGADFWRNYQDSLTKAEHDYGVPAEIIVAIIGVETSYGGNTGKYRVLETLSTLSFDYPKRADYFRKELENYLLLTREEGIDPLALKGSYAGAMGFGQFMPSSYRAYAVDFDGDHHRDLWDNPRDAIGSVANYLSRHRWTPGAPITVPARVNGSRYQTLLSSKPLKPSLSVRDLRQIGVLPGGTVSDQQAASLLELEADNGPEYWLGFDNFYVITRYNQSNLYAMAVYQLSQEIRHLLGS